MDRSRQVGDLRIQRFIGHEMEAVFSQLASLRIQVFHEFPYLYEGDLEYEKKYLKRYSTSKNGFLAAVFDGDKMVGAATALPLIDEENFVQKPFLNQNWPIENIFYFGESLLLPTYRGRGLGHIFFEERENFALQDPQFHITTFCAVIRPSDHPMKPTNYKPLNRFWEKRGYTLQPGIKSEFSWADIGSKEESLKPMQYWMKEWRR